MATNGYIDISEKREVWKQISLEFNGQFKISKIGNTDLEIHRLTIPYKHYQIRISESETKPLKFEIDFNSLLNFKLTIRWEDSIDQLLKRFGKKELEIQNGKFDNHYFLKSKDKELSLKFLTDDISDLILKHNIYFISYQTNSKAGKSKLSSTISRTHTDIKAIEELIYLHKLMIDKLAEINIIECN